MNEPIRLARTGLLTRRVRVVMRAFNANPGYTKGIPPRIEWDDNFIPPDLYPTLPSVPEAPRYVERGMNEDAGKVPGEGRRTADKGKGKAKVGGEIIGGKAPEPPRDLTTQRVTSTAQVVPAKLKAKKKRKVVSAETVENSDEEWNPAALTTPPAPARRPPTV